MRVLLNVKALSRSKVEKSFVRRCRIGWVRVVPFLAQELSAPVVPNQSERWREGKWGEMYVGDVLRGQRPRFSQDKIFSFFKGFSQRLRRLVRSHLREKPAPQVWRKSFRHGVVCDFTAPCGLSNRKQDEPI